MFEVSHQILGGIAETKTSKTIENQRSSLFQSTYNPFACQISSNIRLKFGGKTFIFSSLLPTTTFFRCILDQLITGTLETLEGEQVQHREHSPTLHAYIIARTRIVLLWLRTELAIESGGSRHGCTVAAAAASAGRCCQFLQILNQTTAKW